MRGIFITGTGTDVGKTYVSGIIAKIFREKGIGIGYYKPVLSGGVKENNRMISIDAMAVANFSNMDYDKDTKTSYILENPYSPHLAAQVENVKIDMETILLDYKKMCCKSEFLLVEGCGGIICPINEEIWLLDIVKNLGLDLILVSKSGLGAINETLLTVEYIKSKGLNVKFIIMNNYCKDEIIHLSNKKTIEKHTGLKIFTINSNQQSIPEEITALLM